MKHKKLLNVKYNGFTLIEALVYIMVLAVVMLAVSSFFMWTTRSVAKAKAMRETLDNTRRAIEIITYEIREAKSIYTPTSVFDSHPGQLSLETIHYLPDGEKTSYVDLFLCGSASTTLCLKKEGQSPITLTSDNVEVKNLIFHQIATTSTIPSVQVSIRIDYKAPSAGPEYQSSINTTSTISLRSY